MAPSKAKTATVRKPKKSLKSAKKSGAAMTKGGLISALATKHGMNHKECAAILSSLGDIASQELKKVGTFAIPGVCRITTRGNLATNTSIDGIAQATSMLATTAACEESSTSQTEDDLGSKRPRRSSAMPNLSSQSMAHRRRSPRLCSAYSAPLSTRLVTSGVASVQAVPTESDAEAAYRQLLEAIGVQVSAHPVMSKTPARAAKAWLEMTGGMHVDPVSVIGDGIFESPDSEDLVTVGEMQFNSLCEHHLLPFWGIAHVAYIPNGKVLGLSKFARLLRVFANRLQIQERLTKQLAEIVDQVLAPHGVAVAIEARHSCMSCRGANAKAVTRTVAVRGARRDVVSVREQLLSGIASFTSPDQRARM